MAAQELEDAFLEWSRRERETWEDFSAQVMQRPGFETWNVRVVTDRSGALTLYEKVGMEVTSNWVNMAIDL